MNLVVDRGNTNVKLAVFENETLRFKYTDSQLEEGLIENILTLYPINKAILSTVSTLHLDDSLLEGLQQVIHLNEHVKVPFDNLYETPSTLGRDRIAGVSAAVSLWPNRNVLIIDTGTCLTIDFVTKEKVYLGGNISPGPELRFKSMHEWTSNLPLVERPEIVNWIGKSTESALQTGGLIGCVAEIEGWIEYAHRHFEEPIVVLGSGDATLFGKHIKREIFVRPDLVLTGLNEILKLNAD